MQEMQSDVINVQCKRIVKDCFQKWNKKCKQIQMTDSNLTVSLTEEQRCLQQLLTCPLCIKRVTNAHTCPNCSKFYCYGCIEEWLKEKSECYHCKQPLTSPMLLNSQKLCEDLAETLNRIKGKGRGQRGQECNLHSLPLTYFCLNCKLSLCSDCSLLSSEHRGHIFQRIEELVRTYKAKVQTLLTELGQARHDITRKLKKTRTQKLISCDNVFLQQYAEKLKIATCNYLDVRRVQQEHQSISNSIASVQKDYTACLRLLKDVPQAHFVHFQSCQISVSTEATINEIKQLCQKTLLANDSLSLLCASDSFIVPKYETAIINIKEYSKTLTQQYFYSQTVQIGGLLWRLKIYPRGDINNFLTSSNQNAFNATGDSRKDQYISIFVELVGGCKEGSTKQRHRIQLINNYQKDKRISREFQSQFDIGECWGYDQYAKIQTLYEQNYVHSQTDQLMILLSLAPSSYSQINCIQKTTIQKLNTIHQTNHSRIISLKNQIESKKKIQLFPKTY